MLKPEKYDVETIEPSGITGWLTRRTVFGRTAGNTPKTQKQLRNCTNSVVALQDHCSYTAPVTNHHIKSKRLSSWHPKLNN